MGCNFTVLVKSEGEKNIFVTNLSATHIRRHSDPVSLPVSFLNGKKTCNVNATNCVTPNASVWYGGENGLLLFFPFLPVVVVRGPPVHATCQFDPSRTLPLPFLPPSLTSETRRMALV